MPKKTSRLRSLLKSITLATGLAASPLQGIHAKNAPRDDNNDPAKEWLIKQEAEIEKKNDEYMQRYEEQIAARDTIALTPEAFGVNLPVVDESEEIADYTAAQAYAEIKDRFGHDINDKTAEFIAQNISKGEISMDSVAPEHYALLTSPSAIKNLSEDQQQDLSERFIDYFNQNPNEVPDEDVALVLNSPLGERVLDRENGIKLEIETAERLLEANAVDLENIRKTADGFRAYALDNTFERLDNRIVSLPDGKERKGLEKQATDIAYEYSQNSEILQDMENSAVMGAYALENVFDTHLKNENTLPDADAAIIKNVLDDATSEKNAENGIALGNHHRISLAYGELVPEAYNLRGQLNNRKHIDITKRNYAINSSLREFLSQEIARANGNIIPGSLLDREGDMLYRSRAFYNKSEAYREYSDFSKVYQVVSGHTAGLNLTDRAVKLDRETLAKRRWYDYQNRLQGFDSRQIDFGMYIYYREMMENDKNAKLTEAQLEEFNRIVDFYKKDHLDRMYEITAAVHNKDFGRADRASKAIEKEEGLHINVECRSGQKGLKKTVATGQYREDIETRANSCNYFQEEWNKVARQSGQRTQEENQNDDEIKSIEDIVRQQRKAAQSKPTAKAETQHTSDMAASYINEVRAKANASTKTEPTKSDNKAAISFAIRNNSQNTMG